MKLARKSIMLFMCIAIIPLIVSIVDTTRYTTVSSDINFNIVDIDTNTIDQTDQYILDGITQMNDTNSFVSLVTDGIDTVSTNQHIVINDYQLVKDGLIPDNLPTDHLYFKVYNQDDLVMAIDNDPYHIENGEKEIDPLPREAITDLKNLYWIGNDEITLPTSSLSIYNASTNNNIAYQSGSAVMGTQGNGSSFPLFIDSTGIYINNTPKLYYYTPSSKWVYKTAKYMFLGNINYTDSTVIDFLYDNGKIYDLTNLVGYRFNAHDVNHLLTARNFSSLTNAKITFKTSTNTYTSLTFSADYLKYDTTNVINATSSPIWLDDVYKTFEITAYSGTNLETTMETIMVYGYLMKYEPNLVQPDLVYDVTPLINKKVYSPIFETTFDQMDESQIMFQMTDWFEQDVSFNQFTNEQGVQMIINKDGKIDFIDLDPDTVNVQVNYTIKTPNTSVWASLIVFIPIIMIAGLIYITYKDNET